MPNSRTSVKPSARTSAANASRAGRAAAASSGAVNHPSQRLSSVPVHSDASPAHRRRRAVGRGPGRGGDLDVATQRLWQLIEQAHDGSIRSECISARASSALILFSRRT